MVVVAASAAAAVVAVPFAVLVHGTGLS